MSPILIATFFHILDFISGLIQAFKNGAVTSAKMRDGLFKKLGFYLCYLLAWLVEQYGDVIGLSFSVSIVTPICLYTVSTEVVSIVENIAKINPDILPDKILNLLNLVQSKGDDENE